MIQLIHDLQHVPVVEESSGLELSLFLRGEFQLLDTQIRCPDCVKPAVGDDQER